MEFQEQKKVRKWEFWVARSKLIENLGLLEIKLELQDKFKIVRMSDLLKIKSGLRDIKQGIVRKKLLDQISQKWERKVRIARYKLRITKKNKKKQASIWQRKSIFS